MQKRWTVQTYKFSNAIYSKFSDDVILLAMHPPPTNGAQDLHENLQYCTCRCSSPGLSNQTESN